MKKTDTCGTDRFTASRGAGRKLSFEDEKALSLRIRLGDAARKALLSGTGLTDAERSEKQKLADDGDAAYEQLVAANIPLAMQTAVKTWKLNPLGLNELDDYKQTAVKVICEAARTYDGRRGCRFSTWAYQQLMQEMVRENALTVYALRIPEENLYKIGRLKRVAENVPLRDAAATEGMTECAAQKLLSSSCVYKSLQDPYSAEDPDTSLGEMIPDGSSPDAEEIGMRIDLEAVTAKMLTALSELPEDERSLLRGRMGFDGSVVPLRAYVGGFAESVSGVQKKQIRAENHLRELMNVLPLAG